MMSNMMSICSIITHTNLSVQTHHGFSNFRIGYTYVCVGQKYRVEREREKGEGGREGETEREGDSLRLVQYILY